MYCHFVLVISVIMVGANASLFNRNKMNAHPTSTSNSGLQGNQESQPRQQQTTALSETKGPGRGPSLKGHLENIDHGYKWLIDGVGQILLAIDNIAIEDQMLVEMDDRLVLLYKYYEEDIDQLLTYCKQVTDTTVAKALKTEGQLDTNEEFIVIGNLPQPDENNKGDWSNLQALLWSNQ